MRIGHGYDVHRLVSGRDLILGGVKIPYALGLDGHSDADVLLHAVMDALLGAAALRDIGYHFPDTDPTYKGADSMKLLEAVGQKLTAAGYRVGNIDVTMIAQKPKLKEYIPQMTQNIARALDEARDAGFLIYGAAFGEGSLDAFTTRLHTPALLVLGNEEHGIRPQVAKRCHHLLYIPMLRTFDSLNVAQAGGILTSCFARQHLEKNPSGE